MLSGDVYLKPNVLAEPLVNQWYAWSGLIPPATAAMYIANSHLNIMRSFAANPQAHIAALKRPEMTSGPFIHYGAEKVAEIRFLLEKTKLERAQMVTLAESIEQLDKLLYVEADGHSVEPLYEKIPDPLKGYVELLYDLNNNPSVRFIEGLLYKSSYYDSSSQSLSLSLIYDDDRPFAFNTPRLERPGQVQLPLAFADEQVDELFRMKAEPQPLSRIKAALEVEERDQEVFASFFTEQIPRTRDIYSGDEVRVRYFGHACLLIETNRISILCDPLISYEYPSPIARYTFADLPEVIDYVLITHQHQDHLMLEMLLQLRHRIREIIVPRSGGMGLADPSLKSILRAIGFRNVSEIEEMESIAIDGGSITGIPFLGEHADLNVRAKTAYQIDIKGRRILCLADSNNIEPRLYDHIRDAKKEVDVIFIGMECDGAPLSWIYGPYLTRPLPRKMDQSRRLKGSDCGKAIDIVERLNARQVYVYAMGQEPWLSFVTGIHYTSDSRPIIESDELVNRCLSRGIPSERLFGRKEFYLAPQPS